MSSLQLTSRSLRRSTARALSSHDCLRHQLSTLRRSCGSDDQPRPLTRPMTAASGAVAVDDHHVPHYQPLYVSATRQHVGKTSVSLALMSGLQRRFDRVGFIKPVGQQCVQVKERDGSLVKVDKDVALVKQQFDLHGDYATSSPVVVTSGYTKHYVDGHIRLQDQQRRIVKAFNTIEQDSEFVLAEGTGHTGVGSIVEMCNAEVASMINAKMLLVVNGGLGKAFDELELNRALCLLHQVDIAGVIVNKVLEDKYDQTRYYLEKVLQERWGVPLLGCIPDRPFLGCPALSDLERLLEGSKLITSHEEHRLRHYHVSSLSLVATSLAVFLSNLRTNPRRTLYVCHASRNDILLGFLMQNRDISNEAAFVVCGAEEYPISEQVLDIVQGMEDAPPILIVPQSTQQVMERIHSYTPKLNFEDKNRAQKAIEHYEPYIDFDALLEQCGYSAEDDVAVATGSPA